MAASASPIGGPHPRSGAARPYLPPSGTAVGAGHATSSAAQLAAQGVDALALRRPKPGGGQSRFDQYEHYGFVDVAPQHHHGVSASHHHHHSDHLHGHSAPRTDAFDIFGPRSNSASSTGGSSAAAALAPPPRHTSPIAAPGLRLDSASPKQHQQQQQQRGRSGAVELAPTGMLFDLAAARSHTHDHHRRRQATTASCDPHRRGAIGGGGPSMDGWDGRLSTWRQHHEQLLAMYGSPHLSGGSGSAAHTAAARGTSSSSPPRPLDLTDLAVTVASSSTLDPPSTARPGTAMRRRRHTLPLGATATTGSSSVSPRDSPDGAVRGATARSDSNLAPSPTISTARGDAESLISLSATGRFIRVPSVSTNLGGVVYASAAPPRRPTAMTSPAADSSGDDGTYGVSSESPPPPPAPGRSTGANTPDPTSVAERGRVDQEPTAHDGSPLRAPALSFEVAKHLGQQPPQASSGPVPTPSESVPSALAVRFTEEIGARGQALQAASDSSAPTAPPSPSPVFTDVVERKQRAQEEERRDAARTLLLAASAAEARTTTDEDRIAAVRDAPDDANMPSPVHRGRLGASPRSHQHIKASAAAAIAGSDAVLSSGGCQRLGVDAVLPPRGPDGLTPPASTGFSTSAFPRRSSPSAAAGSASVAGGGRSMGSPLVPKRSNANSSSRSSRLLSPPLAPVEASQDRRGTRGSSGGGDGSAMYWVSGGSDLPMQMTVSADESTSFPPPPLDPGASLDHGRAKSDANAANPNDPNALGVPPAFVYRERVEKVKKTSCCIVA